MKKSFIPQEWISTDASLLGKSSTSDNSTSPIPISTSTGATSCASAVDTSSANTSDIEAVIAQIQTQQTDITSSYDAWCKIGFALSDEFAESGRDYFHKISQYHQDYSYDECNQQYNKCLKANGHGITIKTLFHYAKQAGLIISHQRTDASSLSGAEVCVSERIFNTPLLPNTIYDNLPDILKESTSLFEEGVERDVFLIGALGVLSACLPNIEGIYFDEPVSSHLYAFIAAPAGSGKGKLKWAKYFATTIHKAIVEQSIREQETYEREIENYNNLNKNQRMDTEKPQTPKRKMFFIPANSSSSAFIQALADNDFKGLIFETEADTLAGTLKQDWGNFSDVLRKAFHHESTNMFRRKDNEHIEIEDPHLAIALSGTPKQIHNMMPDTENGLFSRFLYYAFEDYSDFKNPFISHSKIDYLDFFEQKGKEIETLYNMLKGLSKPLRFELSQEQGTNFTKQFNTIYKRNRTLMGNDFNASSRRFGLITFRLAMLLRSLRILEDGDTTTPLLCNEEDYTTAIIIALTLEKHAIAVYQNLPKQEKLKGIKQDFYNALPDTFDRQGYLKTSTSLNIKDKTAEKYIGLFRTEELLTHEHNSYTKTTK